MAKIEWCDRSDWNPVRGCTRVSPGCGGPGPHGGCYAEAMAARFSDPGMWGHGFAERTASGPRWTGKVELQEDRLTLPLSWRKPARIFANSTSDLFHEALDSWQIARVFATMAVAQQHTFQVLTKRPDRMRDRLTSEQFWDEVNAFASDLALGGTDPLNRRRDDYGAIAIDGSVDEPLPNVWLGVSVEDQARADERIPLLLETPAAVRFLSCEPLLGPVDLSQIAVPDATAGKYAGHGYRFNALQREDDLKLFNAPRHIDWVIAGAESGYGARPCDQNWVRDIRDQCEAAGVPLFYKQHAERGRKIPLPMLDGRQHVAFPVTP